MACVFTSRGAQVLDVSLPPEKNHNLLRSERICCRVQEMISTMHRGQILISDEQIRKEKWVVCVPRLCSGNTSLNSQHSPQRHAVPWETSWKFSAQQGKARASQAGEGGNRSPCSSYIEPLLAVFPSTIWTQGTGCWQVEPHLSWTAASSKRAAGAAAISTGKQPGWLGACCSIPPSALWRWWRSPEGYSLMNPPRLQTT